MTKEQAIEILTKKVDSWKCKRPRNPIIFNGLINEIDTENNAIETILSMLKENSAEIEKKNRIIDLILDKINENYNKIFNNDEVKEIIEIYENIKDKNKLKGLDLRKECIKIFFERKSEEC